MASLCMDDVVAHVGVVVAQRQFDDETVHPLLDRAVSVSEPEGLDRKRKVGNWHKCELWGGFGG